MIKFVRKYDAYGCTWVDVVYESGRLVMVEYKDAPKTVKKYMEEATKITDQYDSTFKRGETIYEKE